MGRLPGALCVCCLGLLAVSASAWAMARPQESAPLRYEDAPGKRGSVVRETNEEATAERLVGPLPEEISDSGKFSYCATPKESEKGGKRAWPPSPPSAKCEPIKEVDGAANP